MRHRSLTALAALLLTMSVVGGCAHTTTQKPSAAAPPGQSAQARPNPPVILLSPPDVMRPFPRDKMGLFWEIWQILKHKHVNGPIPDEKLYRGAINGLTRYGGDKHSRYIDPQQWRDYVQDNQGHFCGIGAVLSFKTDELAVIELIKGGPSIKAGLKAGDVIEQVDGQDTKPLGLAKSVRLIRGTCGAPVVLTVRRPGPPVRRLKLMIVRANVKVEQVEVKLIRRGRLRVGYIKLKEFTTAAVAEFQRAVFQVRQWRVNGVVLDLRDDPGGRVNACRRIASAWLGDRVLFKERNQARQVREVEAIAHRGIRYAFVGLPTVVLIDEDSASASEILAGALQDYGRAILVGEKSYGKGSVQLLYRLSNGGRLAVTVEHWFTPKGRKIHGKGLKPDVTVKMTEADRKAKRDPQLAKALEILSKRKRRRLPPHLRP